MFSRFVIEGVSMKQTRGGKLCIFHLISLLKKNWELCDSYDIFAVFLMILVIWESKATIRVNKYFYFKYLNDRNSNGILISSEVIV